MDASKIQGYAVRGSPADAASSSKVQGYVVLNEADSTASKITAYAITEEAAPAVTVRPVVFICT